MQQSVVCSLLAKLLAQRFVFPIKNDTRERVDCKLVVAPVGYKSQFTRGFIEEHNEIVSSKRDKRELPRRCLVIFWAVNKKRIDFPTVFEAKYRVGWIMLHYPHYTQFVVFNLAFRKIGFKLSNALQG